MLSALFIYIARPSVTREIHTKTVADRIMKYSPYGSSIPLVFAM